MKHCLVIALVVILAGMVVNVAVAWGFSVFSGPDRLVYARSGWLGTHPRIHGYWYGYRSAGVRVSANRRFDGHGARPLADWIVDARGWPFPGLCAEYTGLAQPSWDVHWAITIGDETQVGTMQPNAQGWRYGRWRAPPVLPLRPMWPGFALGSLLYSATLGALIVSPPLVRRAVRKRRDRCLSCGYPAGRSGVCTECGKPLACGAAAGAAHPGRRDA